MIPQAAGYSRSVNARSVNACSGTFPVRLRPDDWTSGVNHWLLDVIAPDARAAASVIAGFRQLVKEGSLRLHPIVTRLVDAETLKKNGRDADGARERGRRRCRCAACGRGLNVRQQAPKPASRGARETRP